LGQAPEAVAAGRTLYNNTCTMCHGPDGSEGDRAPSLNANRRYFRLSEAAIFDAVKNGIAGAAMPSSPLPDMDIWRIVAFLRNIRSTASDNAVPGSVENGLKVFNGAGGCARCHMIRGQGGTMGPDLSSIGGQLTLQQLRDALTKERPISPGYRPVQVTTTAGLVIQGIARNEDAFSLQILDQKNKLHLLDKQELRAIEHGKRSLMPHDYDRTLSAAEFQDLIAMLSRQARNKTKIEQPGENEIGR
jgi:putative heme-binding domain-containing protein